MVVVFRQNWISLPRHVSSFSGSKHVILEILKLKLQRALVLLSLSQHQLPHSWDSYKLRLPMQPVTRLCMQGFLNLRFTDDAATTIILTSLSKLETSMHLSA